MLVVRTMAILNAAEDLYLSVITNKCSLSPPLSPPCVRDAGWGQRAVFWILFTTTYFLPLCSLFTNYCNVSRAVFRARDNGAGALISVAVQMI